MTLDAARLRRAADEWNAAALALGEAFAAAHTAFSADLEASVVAERGTCRSCGKQYSLNLDGTIRMHGGWDPGCPGSGRRPA